LGEGEIITSLTFEVNGKIVFYLKPSNLNPPQHGIAYELDFMMTFALL
jgi:hypothetical protein